MHVTVHVTYLNIRQFHLHLTDATAHRQALGMVMYSEYPANTMAKVAAASGQHYVHS